MTSIIIVIVLLLLIGVFLMVTYNSLVILRQRVQNSCSQIDIQLKLRNDLITNLVAKCLKEDRLPTLQEAQVIHILDDINSKYN